MQIIGKDGQQVELKILGYESPIDFDNEWDANWLMVYLNVKSNVGHWQVVDPSLLTMELNELIEWFEDLSQNREIKHKEIYFTEPNLTFELIDTLSSFKTIQLKFAYESKPQFADGKEYFINFQLSDDELATVANDLKIEYAKFPIRPYPGADITASVDKDKKA